MVLKSYFQIYLKCIIFVKKKVWQQENVHLFNSEIYILISYFDIYYICETAGSSIKERR